MAYSTGRIAVIAWNAINHSIYAILFVIRSIVYTGYGTNDRAFYYESYLLKWLIPPGVATICGWEKGYNQQVMLDFMEKTSGDPYIYGWMSFCISSPICMYWYQLMEGIFHIMIVIGSLSIFYQSKYNSSLYKLYLVGLWLEIIIMDFPYTMAYTYLALFAGEINGYPGLIVWCMIIHHLGVLPDLISAKLEWSYTNKGKLS